MNLNNTIHKNTILAVGTFLAKEMGLVDAKSVGNHLLKMGLDQMLPGGFWIWDIEKNIEFYSPNFRGALGFEGEHDFPNVPDSWQKQIEPDSLKVATENVEKVFAKIDKTAKGNTVCKEPYRQMVKYRRKDGGLVELFCSGTLLLTNGEPLLFVGTHAIKNR